MGFLGSAINTAVDAALGTKSGTTLETFLSKYNSSAGKFVDTLDPLTTFDVNIKFYPTIEVTGDNGFLNALGEIATSAASNLLNNVTGGLASSLMNNKNVIAEHDSFGFIGQHTFIEYLAKANLIVGGENWFSTQDILPLQIELGPYVQDVTIPHIMMEDSERVTTQFGEFPTNGSFVKPDNNMLVMQILNTKASLHERIFYPWLKEVTLPWWSYETQPYTTATITVDFTKHNDVKYVFYGCRPSQIHTLQGKQDTSGADNFVRQVTFIFDFMFVQSDLKVVESWGSKLLSTAGTIAKSAASALNI